MYMSYIDGGDGHGNVHHSIGDGLITRTFCCSQLAMAMHVHCAHTYVARAARAYHWQSMATSVH